MSVTSHRLDARSALLVLLVDHVGELTQVGVECREQPLEGAPADVSPTALERGCDLGAGGLMASRRSYGSGRVYVRTDSAGRETYYGSWWTNSRRVNRRLGAKRLRGSREGLTAAQAEAELRRLIREVAPSGSGTDRLDVGEVGQRYCAHLTALGRKRSTLTAVEMALDWALYLTAAMTGLR